MLALFKSVTVLLFTTRFFDGYLLSGSRWNTRAAIPLSMVTSKLTEKFNFIHINEYPDDNYSHILGINDINHVPSKLQMISALRITDVERSKAPIDTQGCGIDRSFYVSADQLNDEIREFDTKYGEPLNLGKHLASKYPEMAIAAEFKRASPSKGELNMKVDVVKQCLEYAKVGAAVISVLTEYQHFKGTLEDMLKVRLATQAELGSARPAILRKDFILDRYQILEARANGADTVLLIVAILGINQLKDLMSYCRSYGMEPLVEVHTDVEMQIALDCGAQVIGVNNRNLHSFQLDLGTTGRIINIAEERGFEWHPSELTTYSFEPIKSTPQNPSCKENKVLIAALSGISTSKDVEMFRKAGVGCCLIGEALMKSGDPQTAIRTLLQKSDVDSSNTSNPLVKICGMKLVEDVKIALEAGAGLIGVIMVPNSPRTATEEEVKDIVKEVRKYGERTSAIDIRISLSEDKKKTVPGHWFESHMTRLKDVSRRQPLVVGVFQNQSPEEINAIIERTGIDMVQLHGDEPIDVIQKIKVPVIKVLHCSVQTSMSDILKNNTEKVIEVLKMDLIALEGKAVAVLLDSRIPGQQGGGAGAVFDWSLAGALDSSVLLAGGLTPENVQSAIACQGVVGVDVSSGVEISGHPGNKDHSLVSKFVSNALSLKK